jgi:acetylornithine deacetylase/succinyl-diaminopimelate desuccinylase-like protein
MINGLSDGLGFPAGWLIRQLLNPRLTDRLLNLMGSAGDTLDPLLHNTVNATVVAGGDKINVIPSQIRLNLDGRLLPGFSPEDLIREVRPLIGAAAEIRVVHHNPGPPEPDMALFPLLGEILQKMAPGGHPMPLFMPGVTDAAYFSRLGIQTYGFLPMILPEGFDFVKTVHAANERIPVEAMDFGTQAIFEVLQRFGEATNEPSNNGKNIYG